MVGKEKDIKKAQWQLPSERRRLEHKVRILISMIIYAIAMERRMGLAMVQDLQEGEEMVRAVGIRRARSMEAVRSIRNSSILHNMDINMY